MAKLPEFKEMPQSDYDLLVEGHVLDASYFYFETSPANDQELAIVFGGREKCAPDFEIRRRTYPYYILEYGINGHCRLDIDSRTNTIEPGTVTGFAPQVPHHYKCDRSNPLEHFWIAFVGSQAGELFEKSTLASSRPIKLWPEASAVIEAIMNQSLNKTQYAQQICRDYLRILFLILAERRDSHKSTLSPSAQKFELCRRYIDQNFSCISLPSQAASACRVNTRYMSRLFRNMCGLSPHEYITRLKLNRAANLLLTSRLSINIIARAVGFDDPYHFSRNFKKFHGMSPLKYRTHHIQE